MASAKSLSGNTQAFSVSAPHHDRIGIIKCGISSHTIPFAGLLPLRSGSTLQDRKRFHAPDETSRQCGIFSKIDYKLTKASLASAVPPRPVLSVTLKPAFSRSKIDIVPAKFAP